jgi:hypothetical protein
MTCTCNHPGCPSNIHDPAVLLAELQQTAPGATIASLTDGTVTVFKVGDARLMARTSGGVTHWMAEATTHASAPGAALDALRTIAAGVCS